jgi:drug/metabolite transporter (DMT)-like permease
MSRSSTSRSAALDPASAGPVGPVGPVGSRAGLTQITVAAVLWGTAGVVVQFVRQASTLSPVDIGFYRLAVAAAVLLAMGSPRAVVRAVRSAPLALTSTGVGLGAYQALYLLAVALTGVSVATVVSLGLAPVVIAAAETVRARRLPSRTTLATLAAGVAGLVLITVSTTRPTASAPHPMLGLLAAIGCGLCYAASTIISRQLAQRIAPMTLNTVSAGIGTLALAPLALIGGLTVPADLVAVSLLGYLGVVTTAVAYAFFYTGLRTTTGSTAAVLTLLEPLTAALLAVLLLGESLPLMALAGGALLLAAVAVLYIVPGQSRSPAPHEGFAEGTAPQPMIVP